MNWKTVLACLFVVAAGGWFWCYWDCDKPHELEGLLDIRPYATVLSASSGEAVWGQIEIHNNSTETVVWSARPYDQIENFSLINPIGTVEPGKTEYMLMQWNPDASQHGRFDLRINAQFAKFPNFQVAGLMSQGGSQEAVEHDPTTFNRTEEIVHQADIDGSTLLPDIFGLEGNFRYDPSVGLDGSDNLTTLQMETFVNEVPLDPNISSNTNGIPCGGSFTELAVQIRLKNETSDSRLCYRIKCEPEHAGLIYNENKSSHRHGGPNSSHHSHDDAHDATVPEDTVTGTVMSDVVCLEAGEEKSITCVYDVETSGALMPPAGAYFVKTTVSYAPFGPDCPPEFTGVLVAPCLSQE